MVKKGKSKNLYFEDDDVIVIDKKTKRRLERQRAREEQRQAAAEAEKAAEVVEETPQEDSADDAMSQIARFCQENNWREAVLTCRNAIRECEEGGREDMLVLFTGALEKLEMSLRRQMASAFIVNAKELLKKEYLLDVGEE